MDVLRACGAQLEHEHQAHPDSGVDAAAVFPGEEYRLGVLLVDVKSAIHGRARRRLAERQLQSYVMNTSGGLGLLIHDTPDDDELNNTTPLIVSLSINRLLAELGEAPLSQVLVQARNEAIHRM